MIKIRCVVERITYQNPENGYSVLKCAVINYNDLITVVGNLLDANVGSVLLIDGVSKDAFIRLRSGIMYALSDVYAKRDQLVKTATELLKAEENGIIMTIDQMLKDEELIGETIMVPQFSNDVVIPEDAAR